LQLGKLLLEVRREEEKEKLIMSAFIGWQMGAGGGMKFGEYLADLGLGENRDIIAPEVGKTTAAESIKKAETILAMARKKKDKGE